MPPSVLSQSLLSARAIEDTAQRWDAWSEAVGIVRIGHDFDALSAQAWVTFCRTLRGLRAKLPEPRRLELRRASNEELRSALQNLQDRRSIDQSSFYAWHEQTMASLARVWQGESDVVTKSESQTFPLTLGQRQKWLNILIKFIIALGEAGPFPDFRFRVRSFAHVPIDNIVYSMLRNASDVPVGESTVALEFRNGKYSTWSRMSNIACYARFQRLWRDFCAPSGAYPADVELLAWDVLSQ